MKRLLDFYDTWMFQPGSARRLGLSRALFYLCYCWQLWALEPTEWVRVPPTFWDPVPLLSWLPQPTYQQACWAWWIAFVSAVLAAIGWRTRGTSTLVAIFGTWTLSWLNALGGVSFHCMPIVLISWVLPFSRCGEAFSLDNPGPEPPRSAAYNWPIRVCWFPLLLPMASAGVHKVVGQWLARPDDIIESFLRFKYYVHSEMKRVEFTPLVLGVLPYRGMLKLAAYATVLLELGSPLALLDRPSILRPVFIGGLFTLQFTLAYVLHTLETFPWMGAYVFWVPWEKLFPGSSDSSQSSESTPVATACASSRS